jgi:hypothetical protein
MKSGERRGWLHIYPYVESLYPLLAVALIMTLYAIFNAIFGYCGWGNVAGCNPLCITDTLKGIATAPASVSAEALPGRSLWVFVMGVNHLACLAAIPVAFYLLRASSDSYAHPFQRSLLLLCLFVVLAAAAGWLAMPSDGINQPPLFQALDVTAKADVKQIIPIVRGTIGVSYAAAVLLALTSCAILWPPPRGGADTPLELAGRMRLIRALLYFSTVLLVIVSLRFGAELRWAAELLKAWQPTPTPPAAERGIKIIESFFSVITSTAAGFNTMMLAAVYLPAAFALRRRAYRLAEERDEEATLPAREKWLQAQGLTLSSSEYLPRIAALLAPLLAGPIGELIGRLTK